jgi:ATP adenylyltransferase
MEHYPEKTAISRNKPARPILLLSELGLLRGQKLDYGCGKGIDAETFKMSKFDPYFFPIELKRYFGAYDTVTCQYVLNVLPKKNEKEILTNIQNLLSDNGNAYITVRRDILKEGLTTKKTFQRNVILDLPILHEEKGRFCIYHLTKNSKL